MIGRDPNIEDTTAGRKPRKNIDCDTDFKKGNFCMDEQGIHYENG